MFPSALAHILTRDPCVLNVDARVGEAVELLVRSDVSMIPIVDDTDQLVGVFSNRSDASRFLLGLDPTPLWGTLLTVDDLVAVRGMEVIGERRAYDSFGGEFYIALEGDDAWRGSVGKNDVVVCGHTEVVANLSNDRTPGCVLLIGSEDHSGSKEVARLNDQGTLVLQFHQSLAELLRGLTLNIRLGAMSLPTGPCIGELDRISDIKNLFTDNHHALPVINDSGQLLGVVSRSDLSRKEKARIALGGSF